MAIQRVQDLGGLGQLAQTILQNKALEQQAIDKERAFGLQEAAGQRADSAADLTRQVREGQLLAQGQATQSASDQDFLQRGLAGLLSQPLAQGTGGLPQATQARQAAQLTSAVPGGTLADLADFTTAQESLAPPTAAQAPTFKGDEQIRVARAKADIEAEQPAAGPDTFSPSPLKKLMDERTALVSAGASLDSAAIKAYDAKISGVDIDIEDMTQDEIDTWGKFAMLGGKLPSFGRGKQSTKIRVAIAKSAARQALGADEDGIPDTPGKTPSEAALDMLGEQSDTKSIQGALNFLDKQLSSMGSFVTNLNSQIDKVGELSKDLTTFDSRFLNLPLRAVRGRIQGSPLQAKYDLYLSEIEAEIGKLATGATASVAELSQGAQEKWSRIHDKNLSVSDMMELLEETKEAANFRVASVQGQFDKTRARMRREAVAAPVDGEQDQPTGRTATNPTTGAQVQEFTDGTWR